MPAYNAEETIEQSVESIFDGNFNDGDEVIVVNDHSTDKTLDILRRLQKKYPRIRVINHAKNKGGGAARNSAVKAAKNPLIFCLDSDNLLDPGSIHRLKDFMTGSGADIAVFNIVKYFNSSPDKITHKWHYNPSGASLQGALSTFKFPGASGNYLFTNESWVRAGRYPEDAGALDTWGFGFRQLATDSNMQILPNSFYYHRYGHDSYWMREARKGQVARKAFKLVSPFIDLLDQLDVAYMKSPEGRDTWFDNIEKRPIKLKGLSQAQSRRLQIYKKIRIWGT
jgi:glycosyltransferase involved in cell wall biosynthesis